MNWKYAIIAALVLVLVQYSRWRASKRKPAQPGAPIERSSWLALFLFGILGIVFLGGLGVVTIFTTDQTWGGIGVLLMGVVLGGILLYFAFTDRKWYDGTTLTVQRWGKKYPYRLASITKIDYSLW